MAESNPYESPTAQGIRGSCTSDDYVEFDYVLDDSKWFALRENRKQQTGLIRRFQIRLGLIAVIFAGLGLIGIQDRATFLVISVPAFLVAAFFIWRIYNASRSFDKNLGKQLERMLASRSNSGVYGRCSVRLQEDGVKTERPAGYSLWHWWAVPEITVENGYLLIYTSSVEANIIPARAFASDDRFEAFVANAKRLWNEKKRVDNS